ncbi:MAG: sugar ABC transporter substrate-binding protein [Eubacterium sp.]|jgi:ABC-type sugar transport system substrate-binding protein|nr:sugar ABC transporter substrate-binding protein [Eubacterium sp.]
MKKGIALLLAGFMCFSLAGCSSSEPGQTADDGGTSETKISAETKTEEDSSAEETSGSGIDWAEKGAASVKPNPVDENGNSVFGGPTEPAKAPTGIKVALIPSDQALSGPVTPLAAIEEVGGNFDWTCQWFNGKGDPTEQNKAIMDAVSWKADVIVCASVDAASIQQGLTTAKEAEIPVVSTSNGTDEPNEGTNTVSGDQLDFAFDVGVDYRALGVSIADWMIADAGNEGSIAVFGAKEYPSCMATEYGLLEELAQSDMEISEVMYFTGGQVGDSLNRQVIGYLQSNPDTKYVFMPYDPAAIQVCQALATAGYDDVKVCSILGTAAYQELIASGSCAAASAAYDMVYMGWGCADQFIRLLNGQELFSPHGENVPYCVIDSTNLSDGDWVSTYDYKSDFLALWK